MSVYHIMVACSFSAGMITAGPAAQAEVYSYSVISVAGAVGTIANGINDSGVVAGTYYVEQYFNGEYYAIYHGFTFDHGIYKIVDPPGSGSTMVTGIGNDGTIVGYYSPDIFAGQENGFILKNGVYTTFGQPGYHTHITAISHDSAYTIGTSLSYSRQYFSISTAHDEVPGHVVLERGSSGFASGINAQGTGIGNLSYLGYVIIPQNKAAGRPLRPQPLPGPSLKFQDVRGINDSGEFVGSYTKAGTHLGYVNNQGVITTIAYPGSDITLGNAINDAGDVLGEFSTASSPYVGFVLHNGTFTPLDGIPGQSEFAGVNAGRQVVATSGSVVYLATPH